MIKHTKLYITLLILYVVFIGILVFLTLFNVISMLAFIVTLLMIVVIPAAIIILIYFIKKAKDRSTEQQDLFKRKRVLDSDTVVEWARDYMRRNYITEIEIKNKNTFQFGEAGERTAILHLQVRGLTDYKYYDLIINAFDKSMHTIITGLNDYNYIVKLAEHLAFAPVYKPKRITRKIQPEGVETTVEEELMPANIKEEITEDETQKTKP